MKNGITYSEYMRKLLLKLGELSQNHNGFREKLEECEWIPFYRLRFKDDVDKNIYFELKKCLESFSGNLNWTLLYEENQPPKRLYTIIPSLYAKLNCLSGKRENARGLLIHCELFEDELYGIDKFYETRDLAFKDIPDLLEWISKYFDLNIEL